MKKLRNTVLTFLALALVAPSASAIDLENMNLVKMIFEMCKEDKGSLPICGTVERLCYTPPLGDPIFETTICGFSFAGDEDEEASEALVSGVSELTGTDLAGQNSPVEQGGYQGGGGFINDSHVGNIDDNASNMYDGGAYDFDDYESGQSYNNPGSGQSNSQPTNTGSISGVQANAWGLDVTRDPIAFPIRLHDHIKAMQPVQSSSGGYENGGGYVSGTSYSSQGTSSQQTGFSGGQIVRGFIFKDGRLSSSSEMDIGEVIKAVRPEITVSF